MENNTSILLTIYTWLQTLRDRAPGLIELLTLFLTIVVFFKTIKKFFISIWKYLRSMYYFAEKINEIHAQLIPNGGSSVRDAIDRIEFRLKFTDGVLKVHSSDFNYGIFEMDPTGKIIWVNNSYLKVTGIESEEFVLGNEWLSNILSDDRERVKVELDSALADFREINLNYVNLDSKKNPIKMQCNATVIHESQSKTNSKIIGYVGTVRRIK